MKRIVKLKKVRYLFLVMWMTLYSNALLGSNMSQFGQGRPVYLYDQCSRSIPGYSVETTVYYRTLWVKFFPTAHPITDYICNGNSNKYLVDGSSGVWVFTSSSSSNCYSSGYRCFFKNDNY